MKNSYFKYQILFSATITILLTSCLQTVENPELPYKEQLVVRCVLEAGRKLEGVEITKTLPPLENYTYEKALISDAKVIVKTDDLIDTLFFDAPTQRYNSRNLVPQSGKKYTLSVISKNMIATATTFIPEPVDIDTFYLKKYKEDYGGGDIYWRYIVYAEYKPKPGTVYLGSSSYGNDPYMNYNNDIKRYRDTLHNGKVAVSVLDMSYWDTTYVRNEINQYSANIDAFDQQYYFYFLTNDAGDSGDDIFGTTGLNIRGNIEGAIGLFIGMASTSKKITVK